MSTCSSNSGSFSVTLSRGKSLNPECLTLLPLTSQDLRHIDHPSLREILDLLTHSPANKINRNNLCHVVLNLELHDVHIYT